MVGTREFLKDFPFLGLSLNTLSQKMSFYFGGYLNKQYISLETTPECLINIDTYIVAVYIHLWLGTERSSME